MFKCWREALKHPINRSIEQAEIDHQLPSTTHVIPSHEHHEHSPLTNHKQPSLAAVFLRRANAGSPMESPSHLCTTRLAQNLL